MRHDPDALMLFAAGFGTRMGRLTANRPKPLIEVGGQTLLDRALTLVEGQGITRTVVNAHYLAPLIESHLAGRPGISVVTEAPDILETGGGLRNALPHLGTGPVFTLNPDAIWTGPNPLATLRAAWDPTRMGALLLVVDQKAASAYSGSGDFSMDGSGGLTRRGPMVYSGAQIIDPESLATIAERAFSLNRVWDRYAVEGRLYGVRHSGGWVDVGTPEGILAAEAVLCGTGNVRV